MSFHSSNLETCHEATGVVVVIDALRAFSNVAYAFSRGAKEIYPISGVEAALMFKAETPNVLAADEVDELPPPDLDFAPSTQTKELGPTVRFIMQSTGAGAKGASEA